MAQAGRDNNFVPTLLGVSNVDGTTPVAVYADPTTHRLLVDLPGGAGSVTSVSVVTANGFAGTVATATSTPAITLTTSVTGILKGNGTAISAITVGSGLTWDGTTLSATAVSGDVTKVGTPVNNQIGVWTGDGTIEGDTALTFDTTTDTLSVAASGKIAFGAVTILDDTTGTTTLSNIDAIDATTETTLEAALDFGNVYKVGTPADNQVGVWTGDGTIEGDAGFTFDGGLGITVADAENKVGLTVTQNDTTNSQTGVKIVTAVVPATQTAYPLIVESTSAGTDGAFIQTYHNSSSPAANDLIGGIDMYGKDSNGNVTPYAAINTYVTDPTDGSEDSQIVFIVSTAGAVANNALYIRGTSLYPANNDQMALGLSTNQYTDLFLSEGGVINWDNGDATLTQTGNSIAWGGITAYDLGTSTALTTGTIELGAASDTTLSRSAAGVLAVEGVVIPSISSTNTLTNKRVTPRAGTTTSSATPTINTDNYDYYSLTAQTADITSFTTNLSGTPTDGQKLWISVTGTAARALTFGASFEASTIALPTTTVSTNRLDMGFVWNAATSKWRIVAQA